MRIDYNEVSRFRRVQGFKVKNNGSGYNEDETGCTGGSVAVTRWATSV